MYWLLCLLLEVSLSTLPTHSSPFQREEQHLLGRGSSFILWLLLLALHIFYTCMWQWLSILSVFFSTSGSTTVLCFYASQLDLRIFPSHCSALRVTLCCLILCCELPVFLFALMLSPWTFLFVLSIIPDCSITSVNAKLEHTFLSA